MNPLIGHLKCPISWWSMPARLPEFPAGELDNIYHRGGDRQRIFFQVDNYFYFIQRVRKYASIFKVNAYCLLPNHFHFLLKPQLSNNLSVYLRRLQQSYVRNINKNNHRIGPLFFQRFSAKHLHLKLKFYSADALMLMLKHSLARYLQYWSSSNYFKFIGIRNYDLYLPGYREKYFLTLLEYVKFVEAYSTEKDKAIEQ